MEIASVSESASQRVPGVAIETVPAVIDATAEEAPADAIAELDRRVRELEAAIGDLRSVKASASGGRKTSAAKVQESAGLEASLRSLDVEQRIAVKSGLIRAGLL